MEETEYRDNEQVLYKITLKLKLQDKEPCDVECLVTRKHLIIDGEEPIKIPRNQVKDLGVPVSSLELLSPGQKYQELHTVSATLTYLDNENNKKKIFLEGHPGSLHYLRANIFWEEGPEWELLDSLKKIGVQAEVGKGVTLKLIGQNIDEIQLYYQTMERENYLAGLIYIVKIPLLRKGRDLYAETDEYDAGIRWTGRELAYRLDEDVELTSSITETGNTDIKIRAKNKPQRVEILVCPASFPKKESFEVLNRIVNHVREVAADTSITGRASLSKSHIVRGSISRRVIKASLGGAAAGFFFGIISVIIDAAKGDLSIGGFIFAGIVIVGLTLIVGLWTFLSLSIKRIRGRF